MLALLVPEGEGIMRFRHRLSVFAGFCLVAQAGVVRAQPVPQSEWPATVRASFQETAAMCREAGTGRMTFDPETYVKRTDFNGDGRPDYVVDEAGLSCPGAASLLCGSAGCGVAIHLSGQEAIASPGRAICKPMSLSPARRRACGPWPMAAVADASAPMSAMENWHSPAAGSSTGRCRGARRARCG